MARLIDSYMKGVRALYRDGKWYIAKPLNIRYATLSSMIKDAIGVLTGKYAAVYFKEEE